MTIGRATHINHYWAKRSFLWLFVLFERIYILSQRKHSVVYSLCDYYSICISPALSLPHNHALWHSFPTSPIARKYTKTLSNAVQYITNAVQSFPQPCRVVTCDDRTREGIYYTVAQEITHLSPRSSQVTTLQWFTMPVYIFPKFPGFPKIPTFPGLPKCSHCKMHSKTKVRFF